MDSKKLDQLPAKDSTANDIRNYLARILVEEYDVTPGHANLTCSDWTYSRQKEFLAFSESTYVGIFGHETGAILYNNVHARKKEMEKGLSAKPYIILIGFDLCAIWSLIDYWLYSARS